MRENKILYFCFMQIFHKVFPRHLQVNLQEQGRLLRQEEFLVWQGRRKCLRRIFIFEDLLLFTKAKRSSSGYDVYVYKGSIKTSDMGLTENLGDSPFR